ncbi:enoyl-CoA hydratase/isomerase family protein [Paraburkholderia sp. CNPSo 3076]|uniref:enoyl-CoA hydratase/isomerase family protein n=1 Tax=Paraburkholderia sp. CNPSo 3076 TaxID=2940936 RepID=UPI00224DC7CB|nr:enoyl-CoA hydratase/isomerase family protein [Paraburkholderia sp. CNPSo 3076]MCX5543808.1 enoyl-CoA hydratase/isomerase family protein [Paraburkholderia sp. CNPSo 3076]
MISTTIENGVATLTLDNAERKNALSAAALAAFADAIEALRRDDTVRALILTGAGSDFCSGGDVSAMQGPADTAAVRRRMIESQRPCAALATFDKPVIAAVDGVAYGAGFSIALMADFIVASERARFCLAFARMGLVPDLGALHTLPRIIGTQRTRDLVYSARELAAHEAQALGIVLEVVPGDALYARAYDLALAMSAQSPHAFAMTKRLLAQTFERDFGALLDAEASAQAIALTSPYLREAAARFARKETPLFRWPRNDRDA